MKTSLITIIIFLIFSLSTYYFFQKISGSHLTRLPRVVVWVLVISMTLLVPYTVSLVVIQYYLETESASILHSGLFVILLSFVFTVPVLKRIPYLSKK